MTKTIAKKSGPFPEIHVDLLNGDTQFFLTQLGVSKSEARATRSTIQHNLNVHAAHLVHEALNAWHVSDLKADFRNIARAADRLSKALNSTSARTLSLLCDRPWLSPNAIELMPVNIVEPLKNILADYASFDQWLRSRKSFKGRETAHYVGEVRTIRKAKLVDLYILLTSSNPSHRTKRREQLFVTRCLNRIDDAFERAVQVNKSSNKIKKDAY